MRTLRAGITAGAIVLGLLAAPADAAKLGKSGGFTYYKASKTLTGTGATQGEIVEARCARGSETVGGGGAVTGPPPTAYLSSSSQGQTREWFIEGWHTSAQAAKLTSWAICTKNPDKVSFESQIVTADPGPSSANASVSCEEGHATGGGARAVGAPDDWFLNTMTPFDAGDPGDNPDDGWTTYAQRLEPSFGSLLVDVMCTKGKEPTYEDKEEVTDDPTVKVTAMCKGDTVVVGGGAFVSGATSQAHVAKSAPVDDGDAGKIPDDGWTATFSNHLVETLHFRANAICR